MRVEIPPCVGEYSKIDVTCNGDVTASTEEDKAPCGWRNNCAAFRAFVRDRDKAPSDYLRIEGEVAVGNRGNEHFMKVCAAQVEQYGVVDGEITKRPVAPKRRRPAPSKRAQRKSAKAVKKLARERREKLTQLFQHFKTHLIENLEGVKFVPPKGVLVPGKLYAIDRSTTSGYIAIYCKQPGVIGTPIAQLNLRPQSVTFDIELPVEYTSFEGIGKLVLRKIQPEPFEDGRFKCICRGMGLEGTALVAQTIARLIKNGRIEL